jgi:hypothetical protein
MLRSTHSHTANALHTGRVPGSAAVMLFALSIGAFVAAGTPTALAQPVGSQQALLGRNAPAASNLAVPATTRFVATASTQPRHADLKSAYFAEFSGVGAEGRDMIWRGAAAGAAVGELTIRLAHAGKVIDTARPTWPVEGIAFVSGEDPTRSLAAEVTGTINWKTHRLELEGVVTDGYLKGARLEQTAELIGYDLSGDMRFAPATMATSR